MAEAEGYLGPHSDIIPDIIKDATKKVMGFVIPPKFIVFIDYSQI